ncbi:MAG: cysteine--tRNA ligase [Clostridiales bacterium]|jgi:cysteinyl-tRNA synthetase|nr:cysteine--tRNA ligase [Clostridiales bacterium]
MKIYNTMSGKKENFLTQAPDAVKIYVCGPTVYNLIHVGNARAMVVFDALRRYLLSLGLAVEYAQNYTDIDDRIIRRAGEEGVPAPTIADRYIKEAEADMAGLNVMPPTFAPRVTNEIPEITAMIQTLINKGHAYEKNGSVFYDTQSFPEYGKLSGKNLDELNAGARVAVDAEKKSPADFVLWKPSKEGEPSYPSPWGGGRPGWHIECSVMAKKYLGATIDLHAGGEDLIFPHHENEIAQSEAANGAVFSRYWAHVRHVNVDNKKMSKSTGNFFTVREVSGKYPYAVIRFLILSSHYRSSVNFSEELMDSALAAYTRVKNCAETLSRLLETAQSQALSPAEKENSGKIPGFKDSFSRAMEDDLNTADAITAVFELVKFANTTANGESSRNYMSALKAALLELCGILGVIIEEKPDFSPEEVKFIEEKIAERARAKKDKNFTRADEIRSELLSKGFALEDTRQGVKYARAR